MKKENEEVELSEVEVRKLTKALNKFWDLRDPLGEQNNEVKTSMASIKRKKKRVCFLDVSQVCGLHFKNKSLEKWFLTNFMVYHAAPIPHIDYKNHKHEAKAMYPTDYLQEVMRIMEVFTDYTVLKVRNNSPIELENDFMVCWIAPRIETA